jgi:NADH:ubiquinone oxidoreductase subunit 3 (subunit A)
MVILVFMVVTIPISFLNPISGELRDPPFIGLFYLAVAGIAIIVLYSSYKERKDKQKANAKRRSRK